MEALDLRWVDEDPDLGIASEGVLCKDMNDISARITKVKSTVKSIDLYNQTALTEIPPVLAECSLLEKLNISHTKIKTIPDFVFSLPNLRYLSCCCNELTAFPGGIINAKKLEKLRLRINNGWSFPSEIPFLTSLRFLTVDFYSAAALPKNFGDLKKLEVLTLVQKHDEDACPALPESFKAHPSLTKLSIINPFFFKGHKTFDLADTAEILSTCPKLENIELSGLAIGDGYKNLALLKTVKTLELRHLATDGNIFEPISKLSTLEKLCLWGSELKITKLPDIFANIKNLREFSFTGNMITAIPPSFYTLSKLTYLEIGSTGISAIDEKIGELKELEKLHVFDNLLHKLPDVIFSLPRLSVLNIEENTFSPTELKAINEKLKALAEKGQKIQFTHERQGHRLMMKKFRTLGNVDAMDISTYKDHCLGAINENANALKYVNKKKSQDGKIYAELCLAAAKKTALALEHTDKALLDDNEYALICLEAAKKTDIGSAFKLINDGVLPDDYYIKVCMEAAANNKRADFLSYVNVKRITRKAYEQICKAAVSNLPQTISKMVEPTPEIIALAESRKQK